MLTPKGRDEPHLPPGANLRRPPPYLPMGFSWDCFNDTRFVSLVELSFTDPRGGLNTANYMVGIEVAIIVLGQFRVKYY